MSMTRFLICTNLILNMLFTGSFLLRGRRGGTGGYEEKGEKEGQRLWK